MHTTNHHNNTNSIESKEIKIMKDYLLIRKENGFIKVSEKEIEIIHKSGDAYIVSTNKIEKRDYEAIEKEWVEEHGFNI